MQQEENFLEYYKQYKDLIDMCIPKEVLKRILEKENRGDAWEPPEAGESQCPF